MYNDVKSCALYIYIYTSLYISKKFPAVYFVHIHNKNPNFYPRKGGWIESIRARPKHRWLSQSRVLSANDPVTLGQSRRGIYIYTYRIHTYRIHIYIYVYIYMCMSTSTQQADDGFFTFDSQSVSRSSPPAALPSVPQQAAIFGASASRPSWSQNWTSASNLEMFGSRSCIIFDQYLSYRFRLD